MLKCGKPGTIFIEKEGVCRFECLAEGTFADPYDPRKFYVCGQEFFFNKFHQTCIMDYEYNEATGYCTSVYN